MDAMTREMSQTHEMIIGGHFNMSASPIVAEEDIFGSITSRHILIDKHHGHRARGCLV